MAPVLTSPILHAQSDVRLTRSAADGNERAFEVIVERYRRPLHRHIQRMLGEAGAEDSVQHALVAGWNTLQRGDEITNIRAWLFRVARNHALDDIRRAGYDVDELNESLRGRGGADEDAERAEVMRKTLIGLAALPERQREALLRTAVEGRSRQEVAEELGLSEGAVRQLVHRARATMRAAATALTPLPLVTWAANAGTGAGAVAGRTGSGVSEPIAARIAELAAGAGAVGAGSIVMKSSAAVVAAGTLAVGVSSPDTLPVVSSGDRARPAATQAADSAPSTRGRATGAPIAGRGGPGSGGRRRDAARGDDRRGRGPGSEAHRRGEGDSGPGGEEVGFRGGDRRGGRGDDRLGPEDRRGAGGGATERSGRGDGTDRGDGDRSGLGGGATERSGRGDGTDRGGPGGGSDGGDQSGPGGGETASSGGSGGQRSGPAVGGRSGPVVGGAAPAPAPTSGGAPTSGSGGPGPSGGGGGAGPSGSRPGSGSGGSGSGSGGPGL